ncbi:hypothetical protein Thiosp_01537 [Thiorhodovibrio litoralis]|nr:hypothetical protein Thiosp_01537 [Thiorhodovibrio litoralis]
MVMTGTGTVEKSAGMLGLLAGCENGLLIGKSQS